MCAAFLGGRGNLSDLRVASALVNERARKSQGGFSLLSLSVAPRAAEPQYTARRSTAAFLVDQPIVRVFFSSLFSHVFTLLSLAIIISV